MSSLVPPPPWDAVLGAAGRAELEAGLPAHLAGRPWYRPRGRVRSASVRAAFAVPGTEAVKVLLVESTGDDDARVAYFVPIAAGSTPGHLVDALAVDEAATALLAATLRGGASEDSGLALRFHAPRLDAAGDEGGPVRVLAHAGEGRPSSTGTSDVVAFGDQWVLKIIHAVDGDESPELELGRFLTAAGCRHTAAVAGWIDVRRIGDGAVVASCAAILSRFVESRGDAWTALLETLHRWLDETLQLGDVTPPALAPNDLLSRSLFPLSDEIAVAVGGYARDAALLGARVGEVHRLLTRTDIAAFAPEPFDAASRGAIADALQRDLGRAIEALDARTESLPPAARSALAVVRSKLPSIERRLVNAARAPEGGVRIRIHGDLHLGQVLFTGDDYVLIDFQGERSPAAPPSADADHGRSKHSPLVDVAGMLRSIHHATATALRARPERERAVLAPWVTLWHRAVSASFLGGWLRAVAQSPVLPAAPAVTRALLDLFLLERCVEELEHGIRVRPDWLDVPLEGLKDVLETERKPGQMRTSLSFTPFAPNTEVIKAEPSPLDPASRPVVSFRDGTSAHAHDLLGAHLRPDGLTEFVVWAPNALDVAVVGDFNAWSTEAGLLSKVGETGLFAGIVRGARAGHRYRLRFPGPAGSPPAEKLDPFARAADTGPRGPASAIASLDHAWGDAAWMASRAGGARLDRPISILEVDLGDRRGETFREIAGPLAARAKAAGYTHVALKRLLDAGFFATSGRQGSPADLMFLVDTLHQAGLGAIFHFTPSSFARDDRGLALFDGAPTFEPDDALRAVHPVTGEGLFDLARPEVASFLLSSATSWIESFHADGLLFDDLAGALYRDHRRPPGTWTPNARGGREDLDGVAFVGRLTSALRAAHPDVLLVADGSATWPRMTRPVADGGLGFDLRCEEASVHEMEFYLELDPRARAQHGATLAAGAPASADAAPLVMLAPARSRSLANQRLLVAMAWAQPGKKLVVDAGAVDAGIARMISDLNRLHREHPALHATDAVDAGFAWLDREGTAPGVVSFLRDAGGDVVVVACNAGPDALASYRVGVPEGAYRVVFDTAAYGDAVQPGLGAVETASGTIVLALPPGRVVFLARAVVR